MSTDPNDFLFAGGAPSCKFPTIGTTNKGTVVSQEVTQQRDIDGNPKTWDDGNPMMQLVVTLQTDDRDASVDNDDGKRRLFIKGQMRNAVADAVKAAGASRIDVGGILAVQYQSDGEKKPGRTAPKQYVAQYQPPDPAADLLGTSAPAEQPAPAPAPAPTSLI